METSAEQEQDLYKRFVAETNKGGGIPQHFVTAVMPEAQEGFDTGRRNIDKLGAPIEFLMRHILVGRFTKEDALMLAQGLQENDLLLHAIEEIQQEEIQYAKDLEILAIKKQGYQARQHSESSLRSGIPESMIKGIPALTPIQVFQYIKDAAEELTLAAAELRIPTAAITAELLLLATKEPEKFFEAYQSILVNAIQKAIKEGRDVTELGGLFGIEFSVDSHLPILPQIQNFVDNLSIKATDALAKAELHTNHEVVQRVFLAIAAGALIGTLIGRGLRLNKVMQILRRTRREGEKQKKAGDRKIAEAVDYLAARPAIYAAFPSTYEFYMKFPDIPLPIETNTERVEIINGIAQAGKYRVGAFYISPKTGEAEHLPFIQIDDSDTTVCIHMPENKPVQIFFALGIVLGEEEEDVNLIQASSNGNALATVASQELSAKVRTEFLGSNELGKNQENILAHNREKLHTMLGIRNETLYLVAERSHKVWLPSGNALRGSTRSIIETYPLIADGKGTETADNAISIQVKEGEKQPKRFNIVVLAE